MPATDTTPYTSRLLPPEEWPKLPEEIAASLNPEFSFVAVVELGEAIVARWAALNTVHLEGLFIDPDHRHSPAVARQLMATMFGGLEAAGVSSVLTLIADPAVMAMAEAVGFEKVLVDNGHGEFVAPTLYRLDR